jgi:hypothetical protein
MVATGSGCRTARRRANSSAVGTYPARSHAGSAGCGTAGGNPEGTGAGGDGGIIGTGRDCWYRWAGRR